MSAWHRTPAGGLAPGPYPDVPGYAAAAWEAYETGRAVPFDDEPADLTEERLS